MEIKFAWKTTYIASGTPSRVVGSIGGNKIKQKSDTFVVYFKYINLDRLESDILNDRFKAVLLKLYWKEKWGWK